MNAPLRRHHHGWRRLGEVVARLELFRIRAEARALLWQAGELDMPAAVDPLQQIAVDDGLIAEYGQDEIQQMLADIFRKVRDD